MATVRMSDKLKYSAIDEAERQFDNVNKKKEIPLDVGDSIYTNYVQPIVDSAHNFMIKHPHVKNLLNLETQSELSVGFILPNNDETEMFDGDTDSFNYSNANTIQMSAERQFPAPFGRHYGNGATYNIPFDCEEAVQIKEIKTHNEDLETKRYEYRTKVQDTLENFTTVNQALKAWPALEKLITDPWVLQRVNEKVQRRKKQEEQRAEIELNETELNSVILTNALIGDD